MSDGLRLKAEDAADLAVISAAVQDAVLKMSDAVFERPQRRFSLVVNRFRWEARRDERVRAALAFEDVTRVSVRNLRLDAPEAVASVLAVGFTPDPEPPGGAVEIALAGGGAIRLHVEALDVRLKDLTAPWPARARPRHALEEG
jgi:hypothetical protein